MNLKDIHTIYFIGIGGIGMSALARYFRFHGAEVHGYDRTETDLTRALTEEGVFVHYDDNPAMIPANVDLVVFTPAVPKDHQELNWFLERGYPVKKRAEVLGIISRSKQTIAIAGTHGKTTTSSLTAHLLRACGIDATAFVGGISANLGGNFVQGTSDWVVAEADEYDRSFLQLHPDIAVINSIDPDHLDIYGSEEAVKESYTQFARQLKPGGLLLLRDEVALDIEHESFGIDNGDIQAQNLHIENGEMVFDLVPMREGLVLTETMHDLRLPYPGRHNVANAAAAICAALKAGVKATDIPAALADFKGVKRRFEYIVRQSDCVYIDDYAHHPVELEATITAARAMFPGRKLTGVFQPHLYSRTRDFATAFAAALDLLDECILLDIYPARELPIEGVNSAMIAGLMTKKNVQLVAKSDLINTLKNKQLEILITMGAGDIDTMIEPIKTMLTSLATNPQN